jgi:macrolide transport system ATP-binding/permease protein
MGDTVVKALRGVSLSIREGEFVAIMGASGSGKSTLMHVLGLLDAPSGGSYRLAGQEVGSLSDDETAALRSQAIGFVFQQFNLLPRLTALENIEVPLLYSGDRPPASPVEIGKALGLGNRLGHKPSEMSGGQQQRVAIARSLVNGPRLILADEPTGNLDSVTQREIMSLLSKLNKMGLTVILVTHENDISRYARRVIWMKDGKVVSDLRRPGYTAKGSTIRSITLSKTGKRPAKKPVAGRIAGWRAAIAPFVGQARAHLREASRSLAMNKMRSVLSTIGILFGVAAVIGVLALSSGAKSSMAQSMASLGGNLLSVSPNWWKAHTSRGGDSAITRLTMDDATALKQAHPAILRTAPTTWNRITATAGGKSWSTNVIGSTPEYADLRSYRPAMGRFFTTRENTDRVRVAVVGRTVAKELFGEGTNPVGRQMRINRVPYTVIGLLPEKGSSGGRWDQDDLVLLPILTAMFRVSGDRYIGGIDVQFKEGADAEEVMESITNFLARRYRLKGEKEDSFTIRNNNEIREAFMGMTNRISAILGVIALLCLVVGGIGIMNIMLVSVTERTREIGLRKAVGARQKDILTQFLVEAMLISVLGGTLGIILGSLVSYVILALALKWAVSVTAFSVAVAFIFSAGVGVGFGFWPARRASALHPAEALRYE